MEATTTSTRVELPATGFDLAPGEMYAGAIVNPDGSIAHHVVLLPGEAAKVTWSAAQAWAAEQSGELPTRREQALLFANTKEAFQPAWYWSSEAHASDGSYAWHQVFGDGSQYGNGKSFKGRARAVRRFAA